MSNEYIRRPEEEGLGLNEITDKDAARRMADIEKPIRDLGRDPEAAAEVRALKPLLDKEAGRLSEKKQLILMQPIEDIEFELNQNKFAFLNWARANNIRIIADIQNKTPDEILRGKNMGKKLLNDLNDWLVARGLGGLRGSGEHHLTRTRKKSDI